MKGYTGIWTRRKVIQAVGSLAIAAGTEGKAWGQTSNITIVVDPADSVANSPEVRWAINQMQEAFVERGAKVARTASLNAVRDGSLCVLISTTSQPVSKAILSSAKMQVPATSEALGIIRVRFEQKRVWLLSANDARGLVYAVLDVVDEASSADSLRLGNTQSIVERPANKVRSMMRMFASDVEDKPWYSDREMWPKYLTTLVQQRFNRFNLAFGLGYDFIREVTDSYFLFAYPFLFSVSGYNVRASNLKDAERDANLTMLKFIAKETVSRGLEFHVGIWTHGYVWTNSPNANHVIEGITPENHGAYCKEAVRKLLQEVPEISGLTFRVHGESGVTEGSYDFWNQVFEGVSTCGRKVSIDMHTKGMDETMENIALSTGLNIQMSPKYWGEHLGMPYQQTDIRVMEQPKPGAENATGLMKFSAGIRSFLRYGYGDLLPEDRKWSLIYRIWPGTQRLLLWGDPEWASAYSRAFSFCGSNGVEIMEMLSFKGRRGSGIAGNRTAYKEQSLVPQWDWQKYGYTTRVWGRMLYNPETAPEVFERGLRKSFGAATVDAATALGHASRILPTVLTAYAPSAGNNTYWPELYWNESFFENKSGTPYSDSPKPVLFQTASTFDPPMFSSMSEFATELVSGTASGKYSPIEVADWLEICATAASRSWSAVEEKLKGEHSPDFKRMKIDVSLQVGLGRFYAARFRSGVFYAVYEQSKDAFALKESLRFYQISRDLWAELANSAKDVYVADITVGEQDYQRGHWIDRLPAMDKDLELLQSKLKDAKSDGDSKIKDAIGVALNKPYLHRLAVTHDSPREFQPSMPINLKITVEGAQKARLHYRHVNQAERYVVIDMDKKGSLYSATIPLSYTNSAYPLAYFFEIVSADGKSGLYPGFGPTFKNTPYYIIRQAHSSGRTSSAVRPATGSFA